ncbi:MAG: cation:proton antiporter [archaeon]
MISKKIPKPNLSKVPEHFMRIASLTILGLFFVLILSLIRQSFFGIADPERHIYFEIVLLLLLAVLAESFVYYIKLQNVIVLMLLGIVISSSFLGMSWDYLYSLNLVRAHEPPILFHHTEIINIFAQLGAVILLFKVGLHSKIEKVFTKTNLLVAVAGIIFPFAAGYLYASSTGGNFAYAMFMGAALSATSVGVTVAILKELNVLGKRASEVIIGAAILDDILSLLVLSFVTNIISVESNASAIILSTFIRALIFILGALLFGKMFIKYLDRRDLDKKKFLISLAFMLALSYFAELIKLSAIVGAFLAGIILNKSRHYEELEDKTYALEYLFMPIFFISLGMLVDIKSLGLFFVPIIIISVIAVLSKSISCALVAYFSKMNIAESALVGIGMVPRGEVALIIAAIGLSMGILNPEQYSVISAMALLTSIIVPTLLSRIITKHRSSLS